MAAQEQPRKPVPVPRQVRDLWSRAGGEIPLDPPVKQNERWTDDEVEAVVKAVPETHKSYAVLGKELGRSPGAVRLKKEQAIRLLEDRPYALSLATDGNHKHADWRQMHKVLQERGYYDLPISGRMHLARHLPQPSSSYRGDHTQEAIRGRRGSQLDRKVFKFSRKRR